MLDPNYNEADYFSIIEDIYLDDFYHNYYDLSSIAEELEDEE